MFTALALGTGLVVFASELSETLMEVTEYHKENLSGYDYRYGWCFFTAGAAFIMTKMAAVLSLTGYLHRFASVDDMASILLFIHWKMGNVPSLLERNIHFIPILNGAWLSKCIPFLHIIPQLMCLCYDWLLLRKYLHYPAERHCESFAQRFLCPRNQNSSEASHNILTFIIHHRINIIIPWHLRNNSPLQTNHVDAYRQLSGKFNFQFESFPQIKQNQTVTRYL